MSDDGYDIPNMRIIPERGIVQSIIVSQMHSLDIQFKLVMSGDLHAGFLGTKTEIAPESIRVTAPPSVLKELKDVKTKPVDVSKLNGRTVVAAELDIPEKVIPERRTVQIKISVERQN